MIERTVIVVGPGGIGKSPLDALFRDDIIKIDPYRLRASGPRDSNDIFYAHPKLRDELSLILNALDVRPLQIGRPERPIEWFPRGKVLFFEVRRDWQFVILKGLEGQIAKAEIYAPILPTLLSNPDISSLLGSKAEVIILNPAPESVTAMQDWKCLEEKTQENCTERGDSPESIRKRVSSVTEEAQAWKQLIQEHAATEYCAWQFPEYLYKQPLPGADRVQHQRQTLIKARNRLLEGNPDLSIFFKGDDEIERMNELLVR
jgi:hypothetical protein